MASFQFHQMEEHLKMPWLVCTNRFNSRYTSHPLSLLVWTVAAALWATLCRTFPAPWTSHRVSVAFDATSQSGASHACQFPFGLLRQGFWPMRLEAPRALHGADGFFRRGWLRVRTGQTAFFAMTRSSKAAVMGVSIWSRGITKI